MARSVYGSVARRRFSGDIPQSEPISLKQVKNNAGGYVFKLDPWKQLDRFLLLGTASATYYQSAETLTAENIAMVCDLIAQDSERVLQRTIEISRAGRAVKNDPALLVAALLMAFADKRVQIKTGMALSEIARTGTHILHFAQYIDDLRGWGRSLKKAIADWFETKPAAALAYQAVKYQSRDGWALADLLRLAKPKTKSDTHNAIYHWIAKGWESVGDDPHDNPDLVLIWAVERLKRAVDVQEAVSLIRQYNIPREAVPTDFLKETAVWQALAEDMPMTALIRNLATLTRNGVIDSVTTDALTDKMVAQLTNEKRLKNARVHPISLLIAEKTYASGQSVRGKTTWQPNQVIVNALDTAFYKSFNLVEPTGLNYLVALDVSGSMFGAPCLGAENLTAAEAGTAMALLLQATEPNAYIIGFSSDIIPLPIGKGMRLDNALDKINRLPYGGTDCSAAINYALKKKLDVDCFVVITDNETWQGGKHPVKALEKYRKDMNKPDAKLAVIATTSTPFSIADPSDPGMLDIAGFDTDTPLILREFALGRI